MDAGLQRLELAARTPDPRERLIALIQAFVDEMADHPSLVASFAGRRPVFNDGRDDEFRQKDGRMVTIMTEAVGDAIAAGALPAIDIRYGAMAIIGMVSAVHKWFDPRWDTDPIAIADTFARRLALMPAQARVAPTWPPSRPPVERAGSLGRD
jgi:Tetracyclin repressor-like, C-terminal domain